MASVKTQVVIKFHLEAHWWSRVISGCPGNFEVITGDGPLPMAIFELLEYIVNEVTSKSATVQSPVQIQHLDWLSIQCCSLFSIDCFSVHL